MRSLKRIAAFTLIELMVTISVLAIISALAAPSFNDMIQRNRRAACSNGLLGVLQWARSEAVRSGRPVTVTAANGIADGIIVWAGRIVGANGIIIQQTAACRGAQVTVAPQGGLPIVFAANGHTGAELNIFVCDANQVGETGRGISVLPTGMVRSRPRPCQ